jgi:hypothetical protein
MLVIVNEGFIGNWQRFTPHKVSTYMAAQIPMQFDVFIPSHHKYQGHIVCHVTRRRINHNSHYILPDSQNSTAIQTEKSVSTKASDVLQERSSRVYAGIIASSHRTLFSNRLLKFQTEFGQLCPLTNWPSPVLFTFIQVLPMIMKMERVRGIR